MRNNQELKYEIKWKHLDCSVVEIKSHYVAQAGLKLVIPHLKLLSDLDSPDAQLQTNLTQNPAVEPARASTPNAG